MDSSDLSIAFLMLSQFGIARLMFFCEVDGSRGRGREHEKLGAWFEHSAYGAYRSI